MLFFSIQRFLTCNLLLVTGGLYIWSLLGASGLWGLASLLVTTVPAYYLTKWQLRVYNQQVETDDLRIRSMQEVIRGIESIKTAANELFWHARICDMRTREYKLKFKAMLIGLVSSTL
jgi:ABC-type bacteriocin/lantibiotic exporter with double-glycine peptidase domain